MCVRESPSQLSVSSFTLQVTPPRIMYTLKCSAPWLAAMVLMAGCAANDAQPATPPVVSGPALDPVTVVAIDSATLAAKAKIDSAKPPAITVPSVPGRNKRDSLALVSAIRAGMKDTRWPVKGPAPLPGSQWVR